MIRVDLLVLKMIGALGIVMLFCCVTLTKGRAEGPPGPQQEQRDPKATANCPDVSLRSIDKIDFSAIAALKKGILGLPCDAVAEDGKSDARSFQHGFDYYSWLTFLALNSPASGNPIGKDEPTVWETYKQLPDVMRADGEAPDAWKEGDNSPLTPPSECAGKKGMIIHMDMEETYNQPFKSGPLIDQNGNYALFVIFMNQTMFEYIKQNSLYNREGQEDFPHNKDIDFPDGDIKQGQLGAIMIKASWKLVSQSDLAHPKYHVIDALLYRGAKAGCSPVKLGLVGFHVGHKTVSRQQWIWTTFEHKDNVPTEEEVKNHIPEARESNEKGNPYSFYKPGCSEFDCSVNQTPEGSWDPNTLGWNPFPQNPKLRSQIVRTGSATRIDDGDLSTVEDDIKALNIKFHTSPQIAGTVWSNYDLITTQWPSGFPCANKKSPGKLPDPTCTPFPTFLANSTLETFSQPLQRIEIQGNNDPGVPLATSSCISCHNNATTNPAHRNPRTQAVRSDFTFILEKAHSSQEKIK
jgi:hypothetical protein